MALLSFVTLPNPTIAAVMPVTVPVNVGLAAGALPATILFKVVKNNGSLFSAVAIFPNVFNTNGAESTTVLIERSTYAWLTPDPPDTPPADAG